MSVFNRSEEQRCLEELRHHDKEVIGSLSRHSDRAASPSSHMEQEKRIRREIANSNERRRMQSINAGFQSLRTLLPHHEGEKLSKAAILQQTAEYIYQLEQEKTSLLSQNCQLKRLLNRQEGQNEASSAKRRKLESNVVVVSESSDEGIGGSPDPVVPAAVDPNRDLIELRLTLDRERKLRLRLEDQVRALESQLYPERIRELTQQVTLHYHQHEMIETAPVIAMSSVQELQETAAAVAHLQVVSGQAAVVSRSPSPKSFHQRNKHLSWTSDLTGFDVLDNHSSVLLGWIGGKGAEIMEGLSEEEVGSHCTEVLRVCMPTTEIPLPQSVIRSKWHKNTYICGGYCNVSEACDMSGSGPSILSEPVFTKLGCGKCSQHPTLIFAGEATHENHFSTTHGAYQTGQKQANVILEHHCLKQDIYESST